MAIDISVYISANRTVMNDTYTTDPKVSDAEWVRLLDLSQKEFVCVNPDENVRELGISETFDIVAAGTGENYLTVNIASPTTAIFRIKTAQFLDKTGGEFHKGRNISLDQMFAAEYSDAAKPSLRSPAWAVHGTTIYLQPVDIGAVTAGCRLFSVRVPVQLTATADDLTINETFAPIVNERALSWAWQKIGAESRSLQAFERYIGALQAIGANWKDVLRMGYPVKEFPRDVR